MLYILPVPGLPGHCIHCGGSILDDQVYGLAFLASVEDAQVGSGVQPALAREIARVSNGVLLKQY